MSNYLAVATVTKALAQILGDAVKNAVSGAVAVTQRPDPGTKTACVDLFLYQVTPNPALRNLDLPTRNAQGLVVSRPTSALDLHYLMSFYGDDSLFVPQRMLGAVVTSLLAEPGLSRQRISNVVGTTDSGDGIFKSNLADAIEQVKFTPRALTLDELSRIWSIFYQVPYALSIAYTATVVTIESEEPVLASQPVLSRGEDDRGWDAQAGSFPQLDSWHIGEGADDNARLRLPSYPSARLGTIITLSGENLAGDSVAVRFTNPQLPAPLPDHPVAFIPGRPGAVKVSIPDLTIAPANDWVAGIYSISIVTTTAGVERSTNSLPLPFAPSVPAIPNGVPDGSGNYVVTVTPAPPVQLGQTAFLSLPEIDLPAGPRTASTDPLTFTVASQTAGSSVTVRVRVDGVDSMQFQSQAGPPPFVLAPLTVNFP